MESGRPLIIYIHGFNSSPDSEKAQQFNNYCLQLGNVDIAVPELSHNPQKAIDELEKLVLSAAGNLYLLVGSSLGGYYATWLSEKYRCRAVLVNPAVSPVKNLGEEFLGPQKNLHTGEEYEFTRDHALFLDSLDINPLQLPENYLLLLQTGDEVLDFRHAVERYKGSLQLVQQGGSHRFEGFEQLFDPMLEFAKYGSLSKNTLEKIQKRV